MPAPALPDTTPADHATLADPADLRDLGRLEPWLASQRRADRRRAARARPVVMTAPRGAASLALVTAALAGPAANVASGHVVTPAAERQAAGLSRGASGAAVRALQRVLGVPADGIFGTQTERALRRVQRARGLPATGVADAPTERALGLDLKRAPRIRQARAKATQQGTSAATVRAIQRALGVTVDGVIGPRTRRALRRYEAARGLRADGRPDATVLRALRLERAPAAAPGDDTPALPVAGPAVQRAVAVAMSKVGAPYRSGATGPGAFDCSGLVVWAMRQAGIDLPRTSFAQFRSGAPVAARQIRTGDLVFFDTAGPGASDVGIATGPDTAVSATTHGVMTHSIRDGYWGSHFVGARRID